MEVLGGPSGSSGQVSLVLHKEGRRKVPALVHLIGLDREGRRNVLRWKDADDPGEVTWAQLSMGRP